MSRRDMVMLSSGQIVTRTLRDLGGEVIFSVSGNQILPIYEAARQQGLRLIHMRHEHAAAYAATATAELSGRPGILLVSAGPAFLAAIPGVAAAASMELPLLFLSGASPTADAGAGGFQDFDQRGLARTVCKATLHARSAGEIGPAIARAWRLALASIPGPVHLSLSADVLLAAAPLSRVRSQPRAYRRDPVAEATLAAMADCLARAQRPLIIARPSAARGAAGAALCGLAAQLGIKPVITECPRGMADLKYSAIVGHYGESDCALVVGPADFTVGFLADSTIATDGSVLLVDAPGDPRPRRRPHLHCQVPPASALPYLAQALAGPTATRPDWSQLWALPAQETPEGASSPDGLHPLEVVRQVRDLLEPADVVVLDGGEFCQWMRLGLRDVANVMLWNSRLGGIGGAIPMALGLAAAGHTGRTIALLGDGAAGYHLGEFETAARYGLPFTAIIGNDARWAAEWHLQVSRFGPDHTFETTLLPARYAQAAAGLGASGVHVTTPVELRIALEAGLAGEGPACIDVRLLSIRSPAVQTH